MGCCPHCGKAMRSLGIGVWICQKNENHSYALLVMTGRAEVKIFRYEEITV